MPANLKVDDLICLTLYRASRCMIRQYADLLDPLKLTYLQFLVLHSVNLQGDSSVKDVGHTLSLDSATLTPLIKKLESRKLLLRERDSSDERIVRLKLTREGLSLRKKTASMPQHVATKSNFSKDDLRDLLAARDTLKRFIAKLEN